MAATPKPDGRTGLRAGLNERVSVYLSYGLVAVMLTCAVVPVVDLAERLVPGWDGRYLLPIFFLVALEGLISWRAAGKFMFPTREWLFFRGAEFVVMFVGLKAYIYNHRGWDRLWTDLPLWQESIGAFFDGEYFYAYILVLLTWLMASRFAADLSELEGDEQLRQMASESTARSDRAGARRQLIADTFLVGGVMLFFTAVVRSDLKLLGISSPVLPRGLPNVILYFVLGLILLALTQFAILRARWSLDRIPIAHNIAPRWAFYSLILLAASALIAIVLPTRYSFGLLDALAFVVAFLQFILYLLILILLLPLQWLFSLLFGGMVSPPLQPELPRFEPASPAGPPAPVPWLELLRSILFWAVLLAIVGFSLYYYVRQRADLLTVLGKLPGAKWLKEFWKWMRGGVTRINDGIAGAIRSAIARRRADLSAPWDYIALRRLSPRERVRFFYLAMVRRGGEAAAARRPAETPFEYESHLAQQVPQSQDDIAGLTRAFVEARYSPHEIPALAAKTARDHWENIRQALRNRRPRTPRNRQ